LIHPDIVIEEASFFFHHGHPSRRSAMQAISPIVGDLLDRNSIEIKSIVAGRRCIAPSTRLAARTGR
jgi:hypothetical protein